MSFLFALFCACCCRNSVQGVAKKPHTFFYGINPVSPTVSVMLAHKLTSLISLLNNILIILVLKEAKAITLACNPSVCVCYHGNPNGILTSKSVFLARLRRVQGKISCAIHWLWCFCKLFTIKTLVQSEKFVTWFDLRKAWANVTVCTYLFLHILVFEGHTYSVSQKKPSLIGSITVWLEWTLLLTLSESAQNPFFVSTM